MGQKDNAQNDYFDDKVRFSDVCNGILYDGKEVIRPEELQEMNSDIVYYGEKEKLRKIIPDKFMMWKGVCIGIIGIENQTNVDYGMVFRTMKAEALSYAKQWNELEKKYRREEKLKKGEILAWSSLGKESRFVPVIMLVIYFGTDKEWDGARCLYDLLDMCEELKPYVNNYKMNLFDYHTCKDFSVFKTENRLLFEALACSGDKQEMKRYLTEKNSEYDKLDMTSQMLLCDLLGVNKELVKRRIEEEGITLCKALQEMYDDGVKEGIEKGIEKGIEQGRELGRIAVREEKISKIRNMLKAGSTKEFILDIGYTEEELMEAKKQMEE